MGDNKRKNHNNRGSIPVIVLYIHADGELLADESGSLWFTPDFVYEYRMTELACSKDLAIGMSPADYIYENETIRGDELKTLLDFISGEYVKFNETHGKKGYIPKVFTGAKNLKDFGALITNSESWKNSFTLFQNALELPSIKELIHDEKYYALSLEKELLER